MNLVDEVVHKYSVSTNFAINFGCGAGLNAFLLSKTFQNVSASISYVNNLRYCKILQQVVVL